VSRASLEACLEDPAAALAELQDEQRRIADELEETFSVYDKKLQAAAKRIASLGPEGVSAEECERLRQEQLELWRLVRRAQAAQRSTRDLVREVRDWQAHEAVVAPEGHPDHPETRVEIIESELRVRGVRPAPAEEAIVSPVVAEESQGEIQELEATEVLAPGVATVEWTHDTEEQLLREIYQHERELTRTTAPVDIADLLRSLRSLHGHLRFHDRRQGRVRLRFHMGLPQVH
jgi:hypothetical protein